MESQPSKKPRDPPELAHTPKSCCAMLGFSWTVELFATGWSEYLKSLCLPKKQTGKDAGAEYSHSHIHLSDTPFFPWAILVRGTPLFLLLFFCFLLASNTKLSFCTMSEQLRSERELCLFGLLADAQLIQRRTHQVNDTQTWGDSALFILYAGLQPEAIARITLAQTLWKAFSSLQTLPWSLHWGDSCWVWPFLCSGLAIESQSHRTIQ